MQYNFLEPKGISQNALARDIGVPPRRINEIVLGNSMIDAGVSYGAGITVAGVDGLGAFADNLDGQRIDRIRYDTPSVYGFILSASWGEDDVYDVALRFIESGGQCCGLSEVPPQPDYLEAAIGLDEVDLGDQTMRVAGKLDRASVQAVFVSERFHEPSPWPVERALGSPTNHGPCPWHHCDLSRDRTCP